MLINKQYIPTVLQQDESFNFIPLFFFPLSGLNLAPVARLRTTWEKLPNKYEKLFQDLQDLFDPSRNMAKYRNVLNSQNLQPPIIPLVPVIKKDLTFLHEGKYISWKISVSTGGGIGWMPCDSLFLLYQLQGMTPRLTGWSILRS